MDKALEIDPTYAAAWRDREQLLPQLGGPMKRFGVAVGDRVATRERLGIETRAGIVIAEGVAAEGPRVLVVWDGDGPDEIQNLGPAELTRLDVELPR